MWTSSWEPWGLWAERDGLLTHILDHYSMSTDNTTVSSAMECRSATAPSYTMASLFICWLIVMDSSMAQDGHTEWWWLCTLVPSNTSWWPWITAMNIINNALQSCIGQFEILAQHGDNAARIKVPATPGWSVPYSNCHCEVLGANVTKCLMPYVSNISYRISARLPAYLMPCWNTTLGNTI